MDVTDTLRSRFRPEWKTRADLAGLETMLENTLSMIAGPKVKKAALEKSGTLNALGIAQALRRELGKDIVPALRRMRQNVDERSAAMERDRAALAKPKIDATDVTAAMLRQETRTYLRGLNDGERLRLLIDKPEPTMVEAALEGPAVLSGLTAETRARVEEAYLKANYGQKLKAMDDLEEALAVLRAAVEFAVREVRANVGLPEAYQFDNWFATAGGTETQRVAY